MADHIVRCILGDRPMRVVAAVTTDTAREAARRHGVVAGGQVALARASTAGLLLATLTKGGERVTVQIVGDGPLGSVTVDATDAGEVRAYLKHKDVLIPGGPGHRVRLGKAVGHSGVVHVVRDLGLKERFAGQSSLLSGEIDADVEHYLTVSEQIESSLGCDAVLGGDGNVESAGGVLVQALPATDDDQDFIEQAWRRIRKDAVYDALAAEPSLDAEALARAALGDLAGELSVLDSRPVRFACQCSRERVLRTLSLMDEATLSEMLREDGGAEITCEFCAECYDITADELTAIIADKSPPASA